MNDEQKELLLTALNRCFPNTTEKPGFRISGDDLVFTGYDLPTDLGSARFRLINLMDEVRIPLREDQVTLIADPSSPHVSGENRPQVVSFRVKLADINYETVMGDLRHKITEDDREHFQDIGRQLMYLSERIVRDGTMSSQDIAQKIGDVVGDIRDRMPEAEQIAFMDTVRRSLTSFAEIQRPRRQGELEP